MKKIYIFILVIILSNSCVSWKGNLLADGNNEVAINNAIIDFLNSSRFKDEFNAFHIIKIINENTISISILGDTNKWLLGKMEVGDKNEYFPTRFKEIDKKLFYWSDSTTALNNDMINIMLKYNVLDTIKYPNYMIPDGTGKSSKKGVHYYFCKTNFLKYKKVYSTISIGYYEPPNLNCE